ncbi:MAG: transcription termination factor Rho [Actinobacteria bacterium]|nr:transcription termination factor Rho [Actinomycetota bacterium]
MSVGQDFDPSLLERKDRTELVAIATTLGGKVPSRAKKAEIVDLILDLAGVGRGEGDAGAAESEGGEAAATSEPAPEGGAESAEGPAPQGRQGSGDRADDARAEDGGDDRSGGSGSSSPGSSSPEGERSGGGSNDDHGGADGNRSQGGSGEEETGNRRRRRRGRDRDRRSDQGDDQFLAEPVDVEGVVDLRDEGYGFLRIAGYLPSRDDAYVSVKQVRQFGLRRGDVVKGKSRPANRNERNPALLQVDEVNGHPAADLPTRPEFDDLTPLFPDARLRLEQTEFPENMTARIIDLLAPIGKGQRGLIVSPPKAGKTTVMKQVVRAIERNHPEVHLIVLLVDERPEEVTDMRRWLLRGEVAASTFDRPTEEHTAVAELVLDRAKRLVEAGTDVVVVLDGITRLARAYNLAAPNGGRTMAGGIDAGALYPPKKFFGAARNVEEGGSLTILATALVETNTRMDEVIFEEFKGTGNMELKLDRRLADRRIFPAIDVDGSSTRHEELLYDRKQLQAIYKLRRVLSGMRDDSGSGAAGLEMLIDRLKTFRTNDAFLDEIAKAPTGG